MLVQVTILVSVENTENPFSKQARHLAVVDHSDFVDAFGFVITTIQQVLVDILEVRQTDFLFELISLDWLCKEELIV